MCNNGSLKAKLILQIKNNLLPKKSENYPRTIFKALQLQKSPGDSHCLQMENMLYLWLNLPGSKGKIKKREQTSIACEELKPFTKARGHNSFVKKRLYKNPLWKSSTDKHTVDQEEHKGSADVWFKKKPLGCCL